MKIVEVPCKVKGERKGKSKIVKSWHNYGSKALMIIIRTVRDHKPLKFFGFPGAIIFAVGFVIDFALLVRWLFTGVTTPWNTLILVGAVLMLLGLLLFVLALIADMIYRQKKIQEEILYEQKKQKYC